MTQVAITIKNGTYGGKPVDENYHFMPVTSIKQGKNGLFISVPTQQLMKTMEVTTSAKTGRVRITSPADVVTVDGSNLDSHFSNVGNAGNFIGPAVEIPTPEPVKEIPLEVALARIRNSFVVLDEMTRAMAEGQVKGMIVFGPPGIGKSYNVINTLDELSLDLTIQDLPPRYNLHSGFMTTPHLFKTLYESCEHKTVLVLDDIDSVFGDSESLNLLKAALDTTGKRWLSYAAESRFLAQESVPNRFEFNGSIILVTNIDFEKTKASKIKGHLDAMISRCHYLDLTVDTHRDKMAWIREVTMEQGMLDRKGISLNAANEIIDFIEENSRRMRELSLRTVLKAADLRRMKPQNWQEMAEATLMRREGVRELSKRLSNSDVPKIHAA